MSAATPTRGLSYLALLRLPGALRFVVPSTVGRVPQAMQGVGAVFLVEAARGSYALAGAVSATLAVSGGLMSPLLGRLADRWGQSRVALATIAVHAPAMVGLVVLTASRAPAWTMFVLAALAGGTYPLLGVFARVRWSRLTGGTGLGWDRALAFESVVDEVTYVVGPSLAAVLATRVAPPAPLLGAAILALAGVGAFVAARSSEPPVAVVAAGRQRHRPAVLEPGMPALCVVALLLGGIFGAVEVSTVAFCDEAGAPTAAGVILSVFSVGSLLGGLAYGARDWRLSPPRRFLAVTAVLGVSSLLVPWAPGPVALGVALAVLGVAVAPTLIATNALVAGLVRPAMLTEGFTWISVAILVGVALGAAAAGVVVDWRSGAAALWLAAGLGVALVGQGVLATLSASRALRRSASRQLVTAR